MRKELEIRERFDEALKELIKQPEEVIRYVFEATSDGSYVVDSELRNRIELWYEVFLAEQNRTVDSNT